MLRGKNLAYSVQSYVLLVRRFTLGLMEDLRVHGGHFKNYALIWRPAFGQRQEKFHPAEDQRYIDTVRTQQQPIAQLSTPQWRLTTQEIIEAFINNRCMDDLGRYFHRNFEISKFIEAADITMLLQSVALTSKPMALLDDRNNECVTRTQLAGNRRPSRGPLSASQLFAALSQEVWKFRS